MSNRYKQQRCLRCVGVCGGLLVAFSSCTLTSKPFELDSDSSQQEELRADSSQSQVRDDDANIEGTIEAEALAMGTTSAIDSDLAGQATADQASEMKVASGGASSTTAQQLLADAGVSSETQDAGPRQGAVVGDAGSSRSPGAAADAGTREQRPPSVADAGSDEPATQCGGPIVAGSCYEFEPELFSFAEAQQRCALRGSHLLFLETQPEEAAIARLRGELGIEAGDASGTWLGAKDEATNGQFVWEDGSDLTHLNFAEGQPDDGPGVDCLELRTLPDDQLAWFDRPCGVELLSICEREL